MCLVVWWWWQNWTCEATGKRAQCARRNALCNEGELSWIVDHPQTSSDGRGWSGRCRGYHKKYHNRGYQHMGVESMGTAQAYNATLTRSFMWLQIPQGKLFTTWERFEPSRFSGSNSNNGVVMYWLFFDFGSCDEWGANYESMIDLSCPQPSRETWYFDTFLLEECRWMRR